jgi:mannose-6-phosphate isomerase-like protein (cupin superfamily)
VPVLTRIRAKSLNEFGDLVSHAGEEYIHVLEGTIVVHTEFYDPVTLKTGEAIYIDSNMGHAYVAAEECDEALVLGVCSSEDEALATSLMQMHDHLPGHSNVNLDDAPARVRSLRRPAA